MVSTRDDRSWTSVTGCAVRRAGAAPEGGDSAAGAPAPESAPGPGPAGATQPATGSKAVKAPAPRPADRAAAGGGIAALAAGRDGVAGGPAPGAVSGDTGWPVPAERSSGVSSTARTAPARASARPNTISNL